MGKITQKPPKTQIIKGLTLLGSTDSKTAFVIWSAKNKQYKNTGKHTY